MGAPQKMPPRGTPVAEEALIHVNGRPRPLDVATVAELLEALGYGPDPQGVAVAVNDVVVPRGEWRARRLGPGDRVEIVGAVQGG